MGAILATSPMATIIHISEKLFRWTAPDTKPSLDFCIANSLLYYFTGTTTSSFWNYFQMYNDFPGLSTIQDDPIKQPAAITIGPYDLNWVRWPSAADLFAHAFLPLIRPRTPFNRPRRRSARGNSSN